MIEGYNSSIKSNQISETYMSLPVNRIIEGKVLSKDGKNLRIEDKNLTVMDIVLKKDIEIKKGQVLEINRRDIESIEIVSQEKQLKEKQEETSDENKLKEIGIKTTDENKDAVKNLKRFEINLTKENIEKFVAIKKTIEQLRLNLNLEAIARLQASGYDIDNMSVWEVEAAIKNTSDESSFNKENQIFKSLATKEISYDEARKIAKEIYGMDMGKDVLDSIRALSKMDIKINKTNIDNIHDVFSKLYNIKEIDNKTLIDAINLEDDISIDLLYKLKNYIQNSAISSTTSTNVSYGASSVRPLTEKDLLNMENELKKFIKEIGLNESDIDISKDLLRKNQGITKEMVESIKEIRELLAEVQKLLDKETAAFLMKQGTDLGTKDIKSLLEMIKEFQAELELMGLQQFTKEELLKANTLIELVKGISKDKIVSDNVKLINLLLDKKNTQEYEYIFSQTKELKVLSPSDAMVLRTASILQSVESLSDVSINSYNFTVSLLDIGKSARVVPQSYNYNSNLTSVEFEASVLVQKDYMDINKNEAQKHYQYLRINIRAVHIHSMINKGIDPLRSDIRSMGAYIEQYEYTSSQYNVSSLSDFDTSKISADIVKNHSMNSIQSFIAMSDNLKPKSMITKIIDKIIEEADKREIGDISKVMKNVVRTLESSSSPSKETNKENMTMFYQFMKETEEIVRTLKKDDKEVFEKYIRQMSEYIKESNKVPKSETMLQIPFYMNQEGSQANVFVKNPKKKDKIDPEDMSILMDLSTKKLGNLGFFIKVDKKNVSVKISADENVLSSIKSEISSLENLLQNIGYELKNMELSGDEDTAKIAFVEDTARQIQTGLDLKV